jgi:hypothetical protein
MGGPWVWGQPGSHKEFQAKPDYIVGSVSKNKQQNPAKYTPVRLFLLLSRCFLICTTYGISKYLQVNINVKCPRELSFFVFWRGVLNVCANQYSHIDVPFLQAWTCLY